VHGHSPDGGVKSSGSEDEASASSPKPALVCIEVDEASETIKSLEDIPEKFWGASCPNEKKQGIFVFGIVDVDTNGKIENVSKVVVTKRTNNVSTWKQLSPGLILFTGNMSCETLAQVPLENASALRKEITSNVGKPCNTLAGRLETKSLSVTEDDGTKAGPISNYKVNDISPIKVQSDGAMCVEASLSDNKVSYMRWGGDEEEVGNEITTSQSIWDANQLLDEDDGAYSRKYGIIEKRSRSGANPSNMYRTNPSNTEPDEDL
jgi:hypothetical protein